MFLFKKKDSNSFTGRRGGTKAVKCARCLFVLFLCASFLVFGCKEEPEDDVYNDDHILNVDLIGIWKSNSDDSYAITSTHLTYYGYGDTISYSGTIKYVSNFDSTKNAGVFIIEYDDDHKASYPIYDEDWNPTGDYHPLKGNFIGVYYQELKKGASVKMGTAYIEGGAEKSTLVAAKNAFTLDREGDYMSFYGTYTK